MTLCQEIQAGAEGLASLGLSDPERQRAALHARGCAACRAALDQGERLMVLIDRELATLHEDVGAEVMARISGEILTSLDASVAASGGRAGNTATPLASGGQSPRGWRRFLAPQVVIPGVMVGLWLAKMLPGHLAVTSPLARVSAALAALAVGAIAAALTVGGAFLAMPAGVSILTSVVGGGASGPQLGVGVKCALFELMFAVIPLAVAAIYAHRDRLARPATVLAVAAAGGSLMAQAVLHVTCHAEPSTTHNLLFHTGPVLMAASLGALLGTRIRSRSA